MSSRTYNRAFSSGELTPELFGRIDLTKYESGLALCQNFIPLPHGPIQNRTGTEFVREVANSASATRLIPFAYGNSQSFAVEIGPGTFRFHTQGATLLYSNGPAYNNATAYAVGDIVLSGGRNYYCIAPTTGNIPPNPTYWYALPVSMVYEIPNPYAAADIFDIHYVQSNDIITLVHPNYAPRELRRVGATNWQLVVVSTTPAILPPPGTPSAVATVNTAPTIFKDYQYVVTSVSQNIGLEESAASDPSTLISGTQNLSGANNFNTITWTAVSGAVRYNVYSKVNGVYGYIGQASGTSFVDNNITPDTSRSPPLFDTLFNSAGNYPAAVGYFEQRRCFAGTNLAPQNAWMTKSGTETNFGYTIPTRDDNAIRFRIAAREASAIRHIVPVTNLLFLTGSTEYRATSLNSDALTATTLAVRPQSFIGSNNVQPVIINTSVMFAQSRGGRIREMAYTANNSGFSSYTTNDISILAPHLFDYYNITDMTFCRAPYPIMWCVSTSGKLLGLSYVPEQQVAAWHQHVTDGTFESVCSVPEQDEDFLYVVVRRTINGATKRYVERIHTRRADTNSDFFFVDCGLMYSGAPVTTIGGLSHLEGKTVSILADGAVQPQKVVTGGNITLQTAASKVVVGLPYNSRAQTLPLVVASNGDMGSASYKNVNAVYLRVIQSSAIFAGPTFDKLTEYKQRTTEPYGSPPNPVTDVVKIVLTPTWSTSGQVCIEQSAPLPLTVASMGVEAAIGN